MSFARPTEDLSAVPLAALRAGIRNRSTPGRLAALRDGENISARAVDNLIEAHGILLDLILRQQLRDIPRGVVLSNRIAPQELTDYDKDRLKWALEQVPLIEGLLGIPSMGR